MLKITKGLKKKKKGKKKHKEEERFEAEVEEYRREKERKKKFQEEDGEGTSTQEGGEEAEKKEKGEEWEKFKALTSGVDDILKKTQDDLDRIKSQSFFQKKPTAVEVEAAEKAEREAAEAAAREQQQREEAEASRDKQALEDQLALENFNFSESEEEDDEDEDIFDTSYVDVVASGEVKLAYIPESPTLEDDGPDPFDTSIADQVIKETPEEKRKKKLVSLGCAVDVLTGKVDKPTTLSTERPRRNPRRPRQQDLLLGSFDEGGDDPNITSVEVVVDEPKKTLLDDDPEFGEEIEVDLSINLAPIVASVSPSPLKELAPSEIVVPPELKSLVSEFDEITTKDADDDNNKEQVLEPDDLDDEFAQLAAESLTKEVHPVDLPQALSPTPLQQNEGVKLKPQRPPPPGSVVTENLDADNFEGDDPFDTSFAAGVVPGKFELKLIEEEILSHKEEVRSLPTVSIQLPKTGSPLRNPLDFDEHNFLDADQTPLSFKHRDLLGGSTTDLSKIGHSPIEPASSKDGGLKGVNSDELSYCDPFDTSVVNDLVAPGKAELKFLEEELLAEQTPVVEEDDDFDPRAEESPPRRKSIPRPEQLFIGDSKRQSIPKVVAFNVTLEEPLEDLLSVGQNETTKASKPLTPYYPEQKLLEDKPSYESESSAVCEDPFDTSFVSSAPGKLELKLIEDELVGDIGQVPQVSQLPQVPQVPQLQPQTSVAPVTSVPLAQATTLKHSVSDPDFDPRACESQRNSVSQDFLSEGVDADTKLHTPVLPRRIEDDLDVSAYSDPFDTSIAEHILPGKAELKLLESELIK